jgi:hypothetical protein
MEELLERARAYLSDLEAARNAALALIEQKAEEAKLIKARQEGFQTALELLNVKISAGNPAWRQDRKLFADPSGHGERASDLQETHPRSARRPVRELILRELSFSGQAMTAAQIAKAITYIRRRTETALERMEKDGQVVRNEAGRWTIGPFGDGSISGHAPGARNGKLPAASA